MGPEQEVRVDTALSVVVPTRDRPERLARCLVALRLALGELDELLVVDSASADATTATVALEHGAHVLREVWPGASRARNRGWQAARHDLVAFVDDDVTVTPGWADALRQVAGAPAFVAGRVLPPPDQRHVGHPVAVVDRGPAGPIDARTTGVLGASANLLVRRDVLLAVGGFDERLGPGTSVPAAEDVDLLDRVLHAGFTGWFEPTAEAWHDQWRTRRERLALDWGYGIGQGVRLRREQQRDPERARRLARDVVVRSDLHGVRKSLADGYGFGALAGIVRLAGEVRGYVARPLRTRTRPDPSCNSSSTTPGST